MRLFYISVSLICCFFFFLRKRHFDFFSLGAASSFVYFLPGIFGFTNSPLFGGGYETLSINSTTYVVFISVFLSLLLGAIVWDKTSPQKPKPQRTKNVKLLFALAVCITCAFLFIHAEPLFSRGKPSFDVLHPYFQISAALGLIAAFDLKKPFLSTFFFLALLLDVYGGNREGLAMPLLGFIVLLLMSKGRMSFYRNPKLWISSCVVFLFFVMYKGVYQAIKSLRWELIVSRLTSSEYYIITLLTFEPFTTQNILNQTVEHDLVFSAAEWLYPLLLNLMLFTDKLGFVAVKYSHFFTGTLYDFIDYGQASNIWAECYAVGRIMLVFIMALLYGVVMPYFFNSMIFKFNGFSRYFWALSGAYFMFFIHRTGLGYQITIQKRIFLIFCLLWFTNAMLLPFRNKKMPECDRSEYGNVQ